MIIFSTSAWDWDVTNKGLTLNEASEYFSDKQKKSYSFPINVTIDEEVSEKLGLVNLEGIYQYQSRIYGKLQIDNEFYDAYISIDDIVEDSAELTFFYGKEVLEVFDKNIQDFNYPVVSVTPDFSTHASIQLIKVWPEATHQFVKVLREDLKTKTNYQYFEGFLNNYVYDDVEETWSFPVNTNEDVEGVQTAINRNVMCPMPYLLEILKVAFASEGLQIRGEFVEDAFVKKIIYIPKTFIERFSSSQYLNYSFSNYTTQETIGSQTINVYKQTHTPLSIGSYSIDIDISMNSVMAKYFKLTVVQDGVTLYEAYSVNTQVNINETVDINILSDTVFYDIEVELRLLQQSESIQEYNNFTYEYKEGSLNIFPNLYTIKNFVPNMKFREFFNIIRTWFNLKVDYEDNAVYLNYLDNHISQVIFKDKTHLQDPKKRRKLNKSNLFKLLYLDKETVLVDKSGQTFNESDYVESETEKIEIDVLPLKVEENYGSITAIYPEEDEDLMFTLWDGKKNGENIAVNDINNQSLRLSNIYANYWSNWLRFRTNSEEFSDTFKMHYTEALNIKEGIFKYNKQHLMVTIKKKRISNEEYEVSVTSETLEF